MPMEHPNAAAIDVGAKMHMTAVRADRTPEPVRSFGTIDLHRLAECGVETVVVESAGVYWFPIFELLEGARLRGIPRQCPKFQARARTQDGRQRCAMAAAVSSPLPAARQLPAKGDIAELRTYLRQRERLLDHAASQHRQRALIEMNLRLHYWFSRRRRQSPTRSSQSGRRHGGRERGRPA
jgi:hypothetical protein